MTIPSSWSLIFEVKSTWSELVFIRVLRLQTSSEDFGRLRKTSDFFGRLQTSSGIFGNDCVFFKNPTHSWNKSLTLISQKKLAGIQVHTASISLIKHKVLGDWRSVILACLKSFISSLSPAYLNLIHWTDKLWIQGLNILPNNYKSYDVTTIPLKTLTWPA